MYSENNSQQTILNRMIDNVNNDIDKSEGSFTYDALSPVSNELAQVYISLDEVVDKFDISKLTGDELATRVYERTGLTKNAATYAHKYVSIVGTTQIKTGYLFQTLSGIQFKAIEDKVITESGIVNIQAVVAGSSGNIPANQITQMPSQISGVVSVTNPEPTEGGYDAETDAALLERYYEKLQEVDTGGNIAHFKSLVKDYAGVGDCKVFPTWNGNNTIKIVIMDSNKEVPSTDLVNAVQSYMDPLGVGIWGQGYGAANYGAFTTIAGATGKTINVSFTVTKDTNYTDAQRLSNVQTSINKYLKSIAFVNNAVVSYAQIGAAILASAGVLDYSNLLVNNGTSNISLSATSSLCEIPVLGAVTINV